MNNYQQYISLNPAIRFGKPCIVGTRIAVQDILGWLASGMTNEEIIEDFPEVTSEHIRAALAFAADREDIGLGILLQQADRTRKTSREAVFRALGPSQPGKDQQQ